MLPDILTIGPWSIRTFTLVVALAILISGGIAIARQRGKASPGALVDVVLGGLVCGVLLARFTHVLINWDYFTDHTDEITQLTAGGLDWHGAVIGGLIGMALVARWRRVDVRDLIDALTLALPLIGLAGWFGCVPALCGYGAEVPTLANFPPLVASETQDIFGIYAPRFNTQFLGMLLCGGTLIIAVVLLLSGRLRYRRFWGVLALLSLGMLVLGFLRGDHAMYAAGLRLDQWLDGGLLAVSIWQLAMETLRTRRGLR